jgi:bacteriorhodopsin
MVVLWTQAYHAKWIITESGQPVAANRIVRQPMGCLQHQL